MTCNPTSLVHQYVTKKTSFPENSLGEMNQVNCKVGVWFLSSAFPLNNIYVWNKLNSNPFCIFQDVAKSGQMIIMKKWLKGDNSIHLQGMIMVLVHWPTPHCHLSINKVSFKCHQQ